MSDRRHFIKTTALASAGLILNGCTDGKSEISPEKTDTSTDFLPTRQQQNKNVSFNNNALKKNVLKNSTTTTKKIENVIQEGIKIFTSRSFLQ